jgi:hypothetical protein
MLTILTLGALMDKSLPVGADNEESFKLFQLAQQAIALAPFLDTAPGPSTCQLLVHKAQCHVLSGEPDAFETMWRHVGLAMRLAQSVSGVLCYVMNTCLSIRSDADWTA